MSVFINAVILGIALAMDALSISISKALAAPRFKKSSAIKLGLVFGGFQAIMPLIGYLVGNSFYSYIKDYFNIISFIILAFLGGKMIYECVKNESEHITASITIRELMILGVATSIDALAAGFIFSGNELLIVLLNCLIIGSITFIICFFGYILGCRLGCIIGDKGEIAGGVVLILLGLKMLSEYFLN